MWAASLVGVSSGFELAGAVLDVELRLARDKALGGPAHAVGKIADPELPPARQIVAVHDVARGRLRLNQRGATTLTRPAHVTRVRTAFPRPSPPSHSAWPVRMVPAWLPVAAVQGGTGVFVDDAASL